MFYKETIMKKNKNAFTMIEVVFVIVVLGILAAIAVPKFAATRDDATIAKGRANIASIRSAIVTERQSRLIQGVNTFIPVGSGTYPASNGVTYKQIDNGGLFGGVLMYPITASSGNDGWSSSTSGSYTYKVAGSSNTLTYDENDGTFLCTAGAECPQLTN